MCEIKTRDFACQKNVFSLRFAHQANVLSLVVLQNLTQSDEITIFLFLKQNFARSDGGLKISSAVIYGCPLLKE